jgi:TolB-like protein/Tfp pilus assembly protein PilF
MAILEYLANASNTVVTRQQLFDAIWPGAEVSDDALTQRISELRKAFGDSPHHPEFIETIPKTGFRLIPEARFPSTAPDGSDSQVNVAESKGRKAAVMLLFGLVLVFAVSVGWYLSIRPEPSDFGRLGDVPSIAVLPFSNRNDSAEDEALAFGIHYDLLNRLGKNPLLRVIYIDSILKYSQGDKPLDQIARELAVSNILQGSLQRSGEKLRVHAQLINPHTNESLWAETFDSNNTNAGVFRIQTSIAHHISNALGAQLSPQLEAQLLKPSTTSLEASEHYWKGQQLMATRTIDDLTKARRHFELAVEIDPDYALAWVGLADSTGLLRDRGELQDGSGRPIKGLEGYRLSIDAAEKAIELNDQLGEGYASLAATLARMAGNLNMEELREPAEANYIKAIKLSPGYAPAYHGYAYNLMDTYHDSRRKLALLEKAAELDPRSNIVQYAIAAHLRELGRYDEALQTMQRLLSYDPEFALAHLTIGSIYAIQGELAEAVRHFEEAERIDPFYWMVWRYMTEAYLAIGDYDSFVQARERLDTNRGPDDFVGYIADFWAILDRNGWRSAIEWLDHPDWANRFVRTKKIFRAHAYVVGSDYQSAYQEVMGYDPRWVDPSQWRELNLMQRNGGVQNIYDPTFDSCFPAGVFIGAGQETLGRELLADSIDYLENEVSTLVEDPDRFWGLGLCYLIEGSFEKALGFFEQYVEHGHYSHPSWIWIRQLPWWDPVRDHPRFIAMMDRVREMQSEQRLLLEDTQFPAQVSLGPED